MPRFPGFSGYFFCVRARQCYLSCRPRGALPARRSPPAALHHSRTYNSTDKVLRGPLTPDVLIIDDFRLRRLAARQSSHLDTIILQRQRSCPSDALPAPPRTPRRRRRPLN